MLANVDNIDEYNLFPLYESAFDNLDSFPYFVVSEECENKQTAVIYIDWLFSNEQARKLVGFGIDGVNYKFDNQSNMIMFDGNVTPLSILPIGSDGRFVTAFEQLLGNTSDNLYYKRKLYSNYTPNGITLKISRKGNAKEFTEGIQSVFTDYRDQYSLEAGLHRKLLPERKRLPLDSFDSIITVEYIDLFKTEFEKIFDREFMDAINNIIKK